MAKSYIRIILININLLIINENRKYRLKNIIMLKINILLFFYKK